MLRVTILRNGKPFSRATTFKIAGLCEIRGFCFIAIFIMFDLKALQISNYN